MGQTYLSDREQTDVPISVDVNLGGGVTGLTIAFKLVNGANLTEFLDFNDGVFKAAGHTTPTQNLSEVDATEFPGFYAVLGGFDLSGVTVPAAALSLFVHYDITAGGETGNEIDTIQFFDRPVDLIWDEVNRGADHNIKDSTGKQQRQSSGGVGSEDVVSATATTVELAGTESAIDNFLQFRDIAIVDGLGVGQLRVIESYVGATKIATLDRAWDTTPDVTSDYLLLLSARTFPDPQEVRDAQKLAPTAGVPAGGSVDQHLDDIEVDTQDIQTRLPAALVGGRMDSSVGAMASGVITAAAIATDAIDADALAADAVDEIADGVWNEDIVAAHGTVDTAGLLVRSLGALISQRANNATLNALLGIADSPAVSVESRINDVETDTQNIQSRLPAALIGGRMNSDVGNMQTGVIASTTFVAGAINVTVAPNLDAAITTRSTQTSVDDIQNTTRFACSIPQLVVPAAGSDVFDIYVNLEDTAGNPEDPDASTITVGVTNQAAVDRSANLDSVTMVQLSTGRYRVRYTVASTHLLEQLLFTFSYAENAVAFVKDKTATVIDEILTGFTVTDRANMLLILADTAEMQPKLPASFMMGSSDGADDDGTLNTILSDTNDIQTRLPAALVGGRMDADVGNMQAAVVTAAAIATDAIGADELATSAVDEISDGVWNEDIVAAHGTADTAGLLLRALGALISQRANNPTLSALLGVADSPSVDLPEQVNTELVVTQGHGTGLWNAAGSAAAVWSEALPGAFGAGTAGFIMGTNLNVTVGSRSVFDPTTTPVELLDTGGAAGTSASELVDDFWAQDISSDANQSLAGGSVNLLRKGLTNRLELSAGNPGFLRLYDDNDTTLLLTWAERNALGAGFLISSNSPARRAKAV